MIDRINLLSLALALAAMLATGCQNGDKSDQHNSDAKHTHAGMSGSGASRMMAMNDKDLASMLIEHHDGAIRMADMELQQGESADVKAMARKMRDQQTKERHDLEHLQQQLGSGMAMSSDMKDKQARAEKELSAAKGHDADHVFLKHMIEHHKEGIQMLQSAMPNLRNDELKHMSQKMIADQQQEIEKMQKMM